jgi:hypothetical protein
MTGTLHEDLLPFVTISRSVLLRVRTVSDKPCRKIQRQILSLIIFSVSCAIEEIMWKNKVEHRLTKCLMRIACWLTKAIDKQCDNCCASMATTVTRKRLIVMFIQTLPALLDNV